MNARLARTALASLLLASALSAQIAGPFERDPKAYASPSGTVTLVVDPSQPSGAGPATYRCTRGATELWAGERPWTLWEAAVTDEGVVAGYAYAAGYRGGKNDSLTIVVLAPDGSARLEERTKREDTLSDIGTPDPLVDGLLLDTEGDRVIVRVGTGAWGEDKSWWTYSLSSGAAGPRIDPKAAFPPDPRLFQLEEARLVPETGLALVRWRWADWDARQFGAVFALLDREGHLHWRLDWPEDDTTENEAEQFRLLLKRKGAILATAPGRFTLHRVATNEQVTFAIDGGDVREVERSPCWEPGAELPAGPHLDLQHLGTISLASSTPDALGRIAHLVLGPGDRIYAADRRTGAVHVFAPDGTPERVCVPAPGDFAGELGLPSLTVTRSGEIYLDTLHFAADGTRLCREDLPGSQGFFEAHAQPESDRMWVFDENRIHLLGPDGTPLRTIERTPEDLPLRVPDTAAVAPDGSLAVATGAYRGIPSIHLYTASGDPVRSIPQPQGMTGWAPFAFDGKRLAIGVQRANESGSVALLDDHGNPLGTFTPPGETRLWIAFFAAKGAELWLLDLETNRIERYATP